MTLMYLLLIIYINNQSILYKVNTAAHIFHIHIKVRDPKPVRIFYLDYIRYLKNNSKNTKMHELISSIIIDFALSLY